MGNKKGVSVIIGYVLLVSFAIIMSVIVYSWMKTYTPEGVSECPDGTSLIIKDYSYDCATGELKLYLTNKGRFNIGGYRIHATTFQDQEVATEDLSVFTSHERIGDIVRFSLGAGNSFEPFKDVTHMFDLSTASFSQIYSVELIPIRWQEKDNRDEPVSCGRAKVRGVTNCA